MRLSTPVTANAISHEQRTFFMKVYLWMGSALVISGLTATWVALTPSISRAMWGNPQVFFGLIIFELILVVGLAGLMNSLSASTAAVLFVLYSFTTGLTLSAIFAVYTVSSIVEVFFVTAGMFVGMGLYGYYTDHDLASWGHVLLAGLLGIILASVANLFLRNPAFDWLISIAGVVIFTGLIAYDTQKIKNLDAAGTVEGSEEETKLAIFGALDLYLDFVNLFLKLLRLLGKRR